MGTCFSKKKTSKKNQKEEEQARSSPLQCKNEEEIKAREEKPVPEDESVKEVLSETQRRKVQNPTPENVLPSSPNTSSEDSQLKEEESLPAVESVMKDLETVKSSFRKCESPAAELITAGKEDVVDAILIQCGRLSRSSSGSGEPRQQKQQQTPSGSEQRARAGHRRRPSSETGSGQSKRSTSLDRDAKRSVSRRISPSPVRRGEPSPVRQQQQRQRQRGSGSVTRRQSPMARSRSPATRAPDGASGADGAVGGGVTASPSRGNSRRNEQTEPLIDAEDVEVETETSQIMSRVALKEINSNIREQLMSCRGSKAPKSKDGSSAPVSHKNAQILRDSSEKNKDSSEKNKDSRSVEKNRDSSSVEKKTKDSSSVEKNKDSISVEKRVLDEISVPRKIKDLSSVQKIKNQRSAQKMKESSSNTKDSSSFQEIKGQRSAQKIKDTNSNQENEQFQEIKGANPAPKIKDSSYFQPERSALNSGDSSYSQDQKSILNSKDSSYFQDQRSSLNSKDSSGMEKMRDESFDEKSKVESSVQRTITEECSVTASEAKNTGLFVQSGPQAVREDLQRFTDGISDPSFEVFKAEYASFVPSFDRVRTEETKVTNSIGMKSEGTLIRSRSQRRSREHFLLDSQGLDVPASVSKACSILEAVADLNSSVNSNSTVLTSSMESGRSNGGFEAEHGEYFQRRFGDVNREESAASNGKVSFGGMYCEDSEELVSSSRNSYSCSSSAVDHSDSSRSNLLPVVTLPRKDGQSSRKAVSEPKRNGLSRRNEFSNMGIKADSCPAS